MRVSLWAVHLLWITSLSLLTSCTPEVTCRELGCIYGFVCNVETGSCEVLTYDCRVEGCPAQQRCDQQSGLCRSQDVSCLHQQCAPGQICNTHNGFCEAASNCHTEGCSSEAEMCEYETGLCVALACQKDSQCPVGYICGASGRCVTGCRINAVASCPLGTYCRTENASENGQCAPQCSHDVDCPYGQFCRFYDAYSTCELEPPCNEDKHCRIDEVCHHGTCSQPPCQSDSDCPSSQICHRSAGICTDDQCTQDFFSPNHTESQAASLSPSSYANLTVCPGHADWFYLDLRAADTLTIRLEHVFHADLELYLYNEHGKLLRSYQARQPTLWAEYIAPDTGRLFIKILSADRSSEVSYNLHVGLNDGRLCIDDVFEENDRIDQATPLPTEATSPTEMPLRLCGYDQDWFVLPELAPNQGLHIRFRDVPAHFSGRLLTPNGAVYEPPPGESFRLLRLGYAGDYYLQAQSLGGHSGSYRLLFHVLDPWDCPQAGTRASASMAMMLEPEVRRTLSLCPIINGWDTHWIRLDRPPLHGTIIVRITHEGDFPAPEITLLELLHGHANPIRSATQQSNGDWVIMAQVTNIQSLFLRVESSQPPSRIIEAPRYHVSYEFTPLSQ